MDTAKGTDYKSYLKQIENFLAEYLLKKAPALPVNIKDIIVKIAPWATLVILLMTLPIILFAFGLGALVAPFSFLGGVTAGASYIVSLVFSAAELILEAMAIPSLFSRSRKGWNLVFYAALLGGVRNIITFNVGGLVIGTLLSLYILFQVREHYK